jgi:hypothetical protein
MKGVASSMLLLLLAVASCTNSSIRLDNTISELISLRPGDEVLFQTAVESFFLFLPTIENFTLDVFYPSGELFRTVTAPTNAFFIYMLNISSRVVARATDPVNFRYFGTGIHWLSCTAFTMTTFHDEVWAASSSDGKGNFTIGHNQNYCLFHLSDAETAVFAECNTEATYDNFRYALDGSMDEDYALTGVTNASYTNKQFSVFDWTSDGHTLSDSFSLELNSPESTLPQKRTFWARQFDRITIVDVGNFPPVDPDAPGAPGKGLTPLVKGLIGAIVGIVVGLVIALAWCIRMSVLRAGASQPIQKVPLPAGNVIEDGLVAKC